MYEYPVISDLGAKIEEAVSKARASPYHGEEHEAQRIQRIRCKLHGCRVGLGISYDHDLEENIRYLHLSIMCHGPWLPLIEKSILSKFRTLGIQLYLACGREAECEQHVGCIVTAKHYSELVGVAFLRSSYKVQGFAV